MEKNLQQIANILIMNLNTVRGIGLISGKMGVTVLLYHCGSILKKEVYTQMGDECLDEIFSSLKGLTDKSFQGGLSGIGFGINYLEQNGLVEIDDEEFYDEFEGVLFDDNKEYLEHESLNPASVFSTGIYLSSRNKINLKYLRENLDFVEHFFEKEGDVLHAAYINSIFHFLLKIYDSNSVNKKNMDSLLNTATEKVFNSKIQFLNSEEERIFNKLLSISKSKKINKLSKKEDQIQGNDNYDREESWERLLYFPNEKSFINPILTKAKIEKILMDEHQDYISNGDLICLGLHLIKYIKNYN